MFLFALCPIASARVSVKIVSETPKSQPGADFQFAPGELRVRTARTFWASQALSLTRPRWKVFPAQNRMNQLSQTKS